jgi:hypothetical protein
MKESPVSKNVLRKLDEFDKIGNIHPSDHWNQTLMERLATVKVNSGSDFPKTKFSVVLLVLFLVNLGFIMNAILRDTGKSLNRNNELQAISKELLINPITL